MTTLITNSIPNLALRFALKKDVPLILDFINKLAVYEKLSHKVSATPDILERSLFGEKRVAEVIIADYEGDPVGFSLFFHNFSTFLGKPGIYIEDIFVNPESRGKGIGKEILKFIAKLAVERGCGRVEWSVLDWNESAIQFYKNLGAKSMDGWTTFRLTGNALVDLSIEY